MTIFVILINYVLVLVCSIVSISLWSESGGFYLLWYLGTLLLLGGIISKDFFKIDWSENLKISVSPHKLVTESIALLFVLAVIGSIYFANINFLSVNIDEVMQWGGVVYEGPIRTNPVTAALAEFQPPLAYILTPLGGMFSSDPEVKVRLIPSLLSVFTVINLWGFLSFRRVRVPWKLVIVLAYALNPWVIRYALEGRPYSVSLYFLSLVILANFCLGEKDKYFGLKLTSFYFYMVSVTFQPLIVMISFLIGNILFFNNKKNRWDIWWRELRYYVYCVILILPYIYKQVTLNWGVVFRGGVIDEGDYHNNFLRVVNSVFIEHQNSAILGLVTFIMFVLFVWKRSSTLYSKYFTTTIIVGLVLTQFISFFTTHPLLLKYVIYIVPLLFLALSSLKEKFFYYFSLPLLFIVLILDIKEIPNAYGADRESYSHTFCDNRELIDYVYRKENIHKPAIYTSLLPAPSSNSWLPLGIPSLEMYEKLKSKRRYPLVSYLDGMFEEPDKSRELWAKTLCEVDPEEKSGIVIFRLEPGWGKFKSPSKYGFKCFRVNHIHEKSGSLKQEMVNFIYSRSEKYNRGINGAKHLLRAVKRECSIVPNINK